MPPVRHLHPPAPRRVSARPLSPRDGPIIPWARGPGHPRMDDRGPPKRGRCAPRRMSSGVLTSHPSYRHAPPRLADATRCSRPSPRSPGTQKSMAFSMMCHGAHEPDDVAEPWRYSAPSPSGSRCTLSPSPYDWTTPTQRSFARHGWPLPPEVPQPTPPSSSGLADGTSPIARDTSRPKRDGGSRTTRCKET